MKGEINYFEFIERYLDGDMGCDEEKWFAKELESNTWLQKEVQLHRNVNNVIGETDVAGLQHQLDDIHASLGFDKPAIAKTNAHSRRTRRMAAAGSVAALVVAAGVFVFVSIFGDYSNEELFAEYYKPYDVHMNVRSGNEIIDKGLSKAMELYEEKDYYNALRLFEQILKEDESRIGLNLYSGISQMEIEEYKGANRSFQRIIDNKTNLYIDQAEWYMAFCYLMTDNRQKAIEQFSAISAGDSYYSEKAGEILSKLK